MSKGIYILSSESFELVYGLKQRSQIADLLGGETPFICTQDFLSKPAVMEDVEFLFTGWGAPRFDEFLLRNFPNLKAIYYAGGSTRGLADECFWHSGVRLFSSPLANAKPVAEFAFAEIILSLKRAWSFILHTAKSGSEAYALRSSEPIAGSFHSVIGILSFGHIGHQVCRLLENLDVSILVYDPTLPKSDIERRGYQPSSLEDVFKYSDVISCHMPLLPETEGILGHELFGKMKHGATFINTARGAIVNEQELLDVLEKRTDLFAVLDVTEPEPPEVGARILSLPNVVHTPHISGSMGGECHRMAEMMIDAFNSFESENIHASEITYERYHQYA